MRQQAEGDNGRSYSVASVDVDSFDARLVPDIPIAVLPTNWAPVDRGWLTEPQRLASPAVPPAAWQDPGVQAFFRGDAAAAIGLVDHSQQSQLASVVAGRAVASLRAMWTTGGTGLDRAPAAALLTMVSFLAVKDAAQVCAVCVILHCALCASTRRQLAVRRPGFSAGRVYLSGRALTRGGEICHTALPVESIGMRSISSIACGQAHAVCSTTDGEIFAWGRGPQLGLQQVMGYCAHPTPVRGLPPVRRVAAGAAFTVAVPFQAGAYAWGMNTRKQLGLGQHDSNPEDCETDDEEIEIMDGDIEAPAESVVSEGSTLEPGFDGPKSDGGLSQMGSEAAMDIHRWGDKDDQSVASSWVSRGTWGQHEPPKDYDPSVASSRMSRGQADSASSRRSSRESSVASMSVSRAKTGRGHEAARTEPTEIASLEGRRIFQISCGACHTLCLVESEDGTPAVYTWGQGALGHGGRARCQHLPTRVEALSGAVVDRVAAGGGFSAIIRHDRRLGEVWTLGNYMSMHGSLFAVGEDLPSPVLGFAGVHALELSCSPGGAFFVVTEIGEVLSLGNPTAPLGRHVFFDGQQYEGHGFRSRLASGAIPELSVGVLGSYAKSISVGKLHGVVVTHSGDAFGWGCDNRASELAFGQAAAGTAPQRPRPIPLPGAAIAVSAGGELSATHDHARTLLLLRTASRKALERGRCVMCGEEPGPGTCIWVSHIGELRPLLQDCVGLLSVSDPALDGPKAAAWSCCGRAPEAPGCTVGPHVSSQQC